MLLGPPLLLYEAGTGLCKVNEAQVTKPSKDNICNEVGDVISVYIRGWNPESDKDWESTLFPKNDVVVTICKNYRR